MVSGVAWMGMLVSGGMLFVCIFLAGRAIQDSGRVELKLRAKERPTGGREPRDPSSGQGTRDDPWAGSDPAGGSHGWKDRAGEWTPHDDPSTDGWSPESEGWTPDRDDGGDSRPGDLMP